MSSRSVYIPTYFQACKGASPVASGVDIFGLAFSIAPFGIIGGLLVLKLHRYRPVLWFFWMVLIAGCGALTTLKVDSSRGAAIGFQVLAGVGLGGISSTTYFPVLAPSEFAQNFSLLCSCSRYA